MQRRSFRRSDLLLRAEVSSCDVASNLSEPGPIRGTGKPSVGSQEAVLSQLLLLALRFRSSAGLTLITIRTLHDKWTATAY